ncbi:serine/threonine protein kinase [Tieghemiomyces parasiticus]|uniref:Serine/threonine protein kinase n=1 Tax=Tieghemiomyces parasiticus TaxID=78921 RepID=A0A9W8E1W1_9FUNG|nr:serine/threonine protein kinase [Tieghemiomyces parasiticus]
MLTSNFSNAFAAGPTESSAVYATATLVSPATAPATETTTSSPTSRNPLKNLFKRSNKSSSPSTDAPRPVEVPSVPAYHHPIRHVPTGYIHANYGEPLKHLGSGTGGNVYLHQDPYTQQLYAIKLFTPATTLASAVTPSGAPAPTQAHLLQRLADEAAVGQALRHPNVIATYDYVREADGTFYSVMEYCPVDMFDMVESGLLTPADVDCYFVQLLRGVHYMHARGVAHRDLKLDNVCLADRGQVKIIDFGCTTAFDVYAPVASGVCGSDPYIAPEVFHSDEYDPRKADVWALAVILLSMMSNHFPWEVARSSDPNFRMYLCYKDAIIDHWMAAKPQAAATIKRMLSLNPQERPTTDELLADPWVQSVLVCSDYFKSSSSLGAGRPTTAVLLPPSPSHTLVDYDYISDTDSSTSTAASPVEPVHYHHLPQRS